MNLIVLKWIKIQMSMLWTQKITEFKKYMIIVKKNMNDLIKKIYYQLK